MEKYTKWSGFSYADGPFISDALIHATPGLAEFCRKGSRNNNLHGYHIHPKDFAKLISYSKEEDMKKNDLYEITLDGKQYYGTYLTKDSTGKLVFELKGSGSVASVPIDGAKRVMPYTVSIKFLSNGNSNVYHYLSEDGKVDKGDLLVVNGGLAEVTGVNTENDLATKELEGWILSKEKI